MSEAAEMRVRIELPERLLFSGAAAKVNAVAENGAFGILPRHVDFVTALVPSVLLIAEAGGRERVFGIDEGLLVKKGADVRVAVRRGVESVDLDALGQTVAGFFEAVEDEERVARAALSRLEADMVRRFAGLRDQP